MPEPDGRSKIRVGVIGIGFGQAVHIPALRACPDFEVVAVCASTEERASKVASRLGIAQACGDWEKLVEDSSIDALTIATPPELQSEIALAALERGKAVFCEKPIALDSVAAERMVEAAERAQVANIVDFELLEVDAFRCLDEVLRAGKIGRLLQLAVNWHVETRSARMGVSSWKTRSAEGGGVLSNFVSHSFSYLETLVGPIARLCVQLGAAPDLRSPEDDTFTSLQLEFESGAVGSLVASCNAFLGSGHGIEFYGSEGSLRLEQRWSGTASGFAVRLATRDRGRYEELLGPAPRSPQDADDRIMPVSRLMARFASWIRSGEVSGPCLRDGLRVQQLLDLARLSSSRGSWVETRQSAAL